MKRMIWLGLLMCVLLMFVGCSRGENINISHDDDTKAAGDSSALSGVSEETDRVQEKGEDTIKTANDTSLPETVEETLKEHDLATAMAKKYKQKYPDTILSVYDLCEYLMSQGFSSDVCGYVCFVQGVDGFYNGAAMYDYERIRMFSEQDGYSREAIIAFYIDTLSEDEATYLVDACLAGKKLTYEYVDDELVLIDKDTNMKVERGSEQGISQDFRTAMDSYEAFYDEYCDVLRRYQLDPTNYSLLFQYNELLKKAAEVDAAFQHWNDDDLSSEELQYYIEVNNRVMQKIASVIE